MLKKSEKLNYQKQPHTYQLIEEKEAKKNVRFSKKTASTDDSESHDEKNKVLA